ncbi:MAG: helix-turn-helix domain-containing protein [Treponema sp.]|nr:helix-turn-helix domain-containing protein [Treponema sp.]
MNLQRVFRVRLYPTAAQQVFLNKPLGYCCFLYNLMLPERIETYEQAGQPEQAPRPRKNL